MFFYTSLLLVDMINRPSTGEDPVKYALLGDKGDKRTALRSSSETTTTTLKLAQLGSLRPMLSKIAPTWSLLTRCLLPLMRGVLNSSSILGKGTMPPAVRR